MCHGTPGTPRDESPDISGINEEGGKISEIKVQIKRPPEGAGCAMAHPDFGRSVNPISTRGDRLSPPNYYWHTRIFRPSDGPEYTAQEHTNKQWHPMANYRIV